MRGNRFGGGIAGVLVGVAMILGGVALLLATRDVVPPMVAYVIGGMLAVSGLALITASVTLPRALIWRRSPSGRGYEPIARYFAAPSRASEGLCWHCGAPIRRYATICPVCGATRPKKRHTLLPTLRPAHRAPGPAAVVPAEPPRARRDPAASAFPLYTPGSSGGEDLSGRSPPETPSLGAGLAGLPPLPDLPESRRAAESPMWSEDGGLAE